MSPLLLYLIESSICLAFLYLIYLLFLKEDTFHKTKRFYLLASLALSLIIPVLPSPGEISEVRQIIVPAKVRNVNNQHFRDPFEKIVITALPKETPEYNQPEKISFTNVFFPVYFLISGFMLFRLSRNFRKAFKLVKNNKHENYGRYKIILLQDEYSSFSFLNYIFLNKSLNDPERQKILQHEVAHARQKHSYDLIFFELYKVFFWINPLVWYYKTSLSQVHECLADESIVTNSDIDDYQLLLLTTYLSNYRIELAHSFNYSLIKFRIKMMTKTKSKWWAKYKIAFAIPVILLVLVAFTRTMDKKAEEQHSTFKKGTSIKGWVLAGASPEIYEVGIDSSTSVHGQKSAYIHSVSASSSWSTLLQRMNVKAYLGKRIKMTGYIKTMSSAESAQMWIRVDDIDKKMSTEFDNMNSRPVIGSTEWKKYEIVFEVPEKCAVFYGVIINGSGKIWFDNINFEIVDNSTPKTTWLIDQPFPPVYLDQIKEMPAILPEKLPSNLDFEE